MSHDMTLWYTEPAEEWTEALPLGNGRIGAMVFGGIKRELISLNEDTLWSGYPRDKGNPAAGESFPMIRELVRQGKLSEAEALFESGMSGAYTESYMPLGGLLMEFSDLDGEVTCYQRELTLKDAVARTRFTSGGAAYTREVFVSAPDQVMAVKLSADRPGSINVMLGMDSQLRHTVTAEGRRIELEGLCPSCVIPSYKPSDEPIAYWPEDERKGMRFLAVLDVEAAGGSVAAHNGKLAVTGADTVILRFCTRTSFNGFDRHPYTDGKPYRDNCLNDLERALVKSYDGLLAEHIADHSALFGRVELSLSGPSKESLPTADRLIALEKEPYDAGLFALIFQYGRYLTIAASRPETQAANLQGIWNKELRPPWSSNYTVNINTEMNYWPADSCNLSECHRPLFDLIREISVTGARTAKTHYGAGGFTSHHNTDLWRLSTPVGNGLEGSTVFAFWPMSAGWLCRHLFEHYEYTLDRVFLRETAYPLIRGAAEFYLDLLEEDENGRLVMLPSTSPENKFLLNGKTLSLCKTTAMTMEIVRETFDNLVAACDILGIEDALANKARESVKRLIPLKIGAKGQLLEWDAEYEEAEPDHRHTSHLYALHPAHYITPEETPELAEACRTSLRLRGDDGTGWCLAWRVNKWARLRDGGHALKLVKRQLRLVRTSAVEMRHGGGTYPNLLDAHPPFQIDGNYGTTAGIAEMFLQCRGKIIDLLPALPPEFQDGEVKGLRAYGGLTVDLFFAGNRLASARLTAGEDMGQAYKIAYGGADMEICLSKGESVILTPADFK